MPMDEYPTGSRPFSEVCGTNLFKIHSEAFAGHLNVAITQLEDHDPGVIVPQYQKPKSLDRLGGPSSELESTYVRYPTMHGSCGRHRP